jgi:hypothetical protein
MVGNIMSVSLSEHAPILERLVNCFLSHSNPSLHGFCLRRVDKTCRAFHIQWCLTNLPIICLDAFRRGKHSHEAFLKDDNVRVSATCKWSINQHNITSQDAQANFIAESWLLSILLAWEWWAVLGAFEVSSINRYYTKQQEDQLQTSHKNGNLLIHLLLSLPPWPFVINSSYLFLYICKRRLRLFLSFVAAVNREPGFSKRMANGKEGFSHWGQSTNSFHSYKAN